TEKFMKSIEKYKRKRNFIDRAIYSHLIMKKKKIAISNLKKELDFADIIIDYDMGLLRHINKLNLIGKKVVGWCHLGNGDHIGSKKKKKNLKKFTNIVTINQEMADGYKKNYPDYNFKIDLIYNFMDESVIIEKSLEKVEEELEAYIVSVGALTEIKNHTMLIKAYKILVDKGRKENLVIIGEGIEREKLEVLIKELKLKNRVILLGRKENPYKYMKNSQFYIQTSWQEGMPLVVIEAMILGKAVVCTRNSGTEEILKDSKYGLVVDIEVEKIADTMEKIILSSDLKEKYEELSFKRSKDFFKEEGKNNIERFIDFI
ncbi:MAG: glycosyltransferase, partial [Cetobacterium sp.]